MDHIFRIAFCMLSIAYLQGKPTPSTNGPTFDYDPDIIIDILSDTKKLLSSTMTCAKGSTFYTADFTKECVEAALHCSLLELKVVAAECSAPAGSEDDHVENIISSLENVLPPREWTENSRGTEFSSECMCENQKSEQLEEFITNLQTGLQWIQST